MFYGFVFKVKLPGSESCTSAAAHHSPGAGAPWGGGSHPQLLQCLGTQELGSDPRAAPQRTPKETEVTRAAPEGRRWGGSGILCLTSTSFHQIQNLCSCSQQSESTLSSSKVRPSNPPLPAAWWEHLKTVSVLERGTAELPLHSPAPRGFAVCWVTLEQLLHVTLCCWSCPGRKAQTWTQVLPPRHEWGTQPETPEGLQQHRQGYWDFIPLKGQAGTGGYY